VKNICTLTAAFVLLAGGLTANAQIAAETRVEDQPPVVIKEIPNPEALESEENRTLNLMDYFDDPDHPDGLMFFTVLLNSNAEVATATVNRLDLEIDYLSPGQTTIVIQANSGGLTTADTFVIGVRPLITGDYEIAAFEELSLEPESYWYGDDESGEFTSGPIKFLNNYNPEWFAWYGWAYSNTTDNTSYGWLNESSAYSGVRLDSAAGKIYGISYASPLSSIEMNGPSNQEIKGFFINNSTWAALSMKNGDDFSKKFGGADGKEPDWFKLTIEGRDMNGNTASSDFMLADFTFQDSTKDYILETWQWVDLSSLGKVHNLTFTLSSSDNGDWGMNTPAYFCIDNVYVVPDLPPVVLNPLEDASGEPGTSLAINISEVFDDPDDADSLISIQIVDDSWNAEVLSPSIIGDTLYIDLLADGYSTLTLAALSNGKSISDNIYLTVNSTGVSSLNSNNIILYPNPSNGQFRIATYSPDPLDLQIYDTGGRLIFHESKYTPGNLIDISKQHKGIYILKLNNTYENTTKKIVLQ